MLVSVIIPTHNESENVAIISKQIASVFEPLEEEYELIFVDDSDDDTPLRLLAIAEEDRNIRVIFLTRSFGQAAAIKAGLSKCSGEAAIVMDVDGQDPPNLIPLLIENWKQGFEVVLTQRDSQGTRIYEYFAKIFYAILSKFGEIPIPAKSGEFRLIDRKVIDFLTYSEEKNIFFRGQSVWPGYKSIALKFERNTRISGKSNYNFRKSARVAANGITGFSLAPLRLGYLAGFFFAGVSILVGAVGIAIKWLNPKLFSPGYMSLVVLIIVTTAFNLLFLAIIGEYIGKIYQQVLGRPDYVVRSQINFDGKN